MAKIIFKIFSFILTSAVIYFLIAFVAILLGRPQKPASEQRGLNFRKLFIDYSGVPELQNFKARNGTNLAYRHYPAKSDKVVILFHGAAYHSRYFLPLAEFISSENLAQVYTPDLRGHGLKPEKRGDIDYMYQLDDDAADLINMIKKNNPKSIIIVGGHSSGGGMAIRFAGSKYGNQADAYLLLAPIIKYNAPTTRPNSGGFSRSYFGRFMGLSMLNSVGIRSLNDMKAIEFYIPEEARNGTETLSYSYRLITSFTAEHYKKDLGAITQPLLVVAGTDDEAMFADKYEPVISQYTEAKVRLIEGSSHFGLIVSPEIRPIIREWLEGIENIKKSKQI